MRARHELMKMKYPDVPNAKGIPYTGLSNARPETLAIAERVKALADSSAVRRRRVPGVRHSGQRLRRRLGQVAILVSDPAGRRSRWPAGIHSTSAVRRARHEQNCVSQKFSEEECPRRDWISPHWQHQAARWSLRRSKSLRKSLPSRSQDMPMTVSVPSWMEG